MIRFLVSVFVVGVAAAAAAPKAPRSRGIESPGYTWNAQEPEKLAALRLVGDVQRGKEAYAVCAPCHQLSGVGSADGRFPRLAGQHATVIIKQLSDIRVGLRDNPVMYPYAATLTDPQELADLGAYVASMPIPRDTGRGRGVKLDQGRALYERDCAGCHGREGEGNGPAFFPQVAGQHFKYVARQLAEVRARQRRNANPVMAALLKPYAQEELEAVADYVSRLSPRASSSSSSSSR